MSVIKGIAVTEMALLTSTKQLHFATQKVGEGSLIEEECRRAFQQGVERGEKMGYEKYATENRAFLELLTQLAQNCVNQKKRLLDSLKPEIVEFCIHICERILRKELGQPEAMAALIHSLLNVCASQLTSEMLHIILAPEDLMMLEDHLPQIHFNKREIKGLSFRADPLMKRGDCRIEAKSGLLNYSISRELADLQAKILH